MHNFRIAISTDLYWVHPICNVSCPLKNYFICLKGGGVEANNNSKKGFNILIILVVEDQNRICTDAEFMSVQFVEVSGHNLESSQNGGFRVQCLHYKPDDCE